MVLARQHLFISLPNAQTVSGWSNLGIVLGRQYLFISLACAQSNQSFDGSRSKICQLCGSTKSFTIFLMQEMLLNSRIIMYKI